MQDAYNLQTTNIKRLSRYHVEDVIKCKEGDSFVLYFRADNDLINNRYQGLPTSAALVQKEDGIGGETVRIAGHDYICIKATIIMATLHHDIKYGSMTLNQFERFYNRDEGFRVSFHGTEDGLTLSWRSVVDHCVDLLIFGQPLDGARLYSLLLRWTTNEQKLRSV